jgi:hypothetical protein
MSRWLNIIFAILYTLVNAFAAFTTTWAYFIFFGIVESMLTLLIVWYAWKWTNSKVE